VSDGGRLPSESLSPLAGAVDRVLAGHGYDLSAGIDAIDAAVQGVGGLFDPNTTSAELRDAIESVLAGDVRPPSHPDLGGDVAVVYVDGSSRGNPGPAGAGAVVVDGAGEELVRLGRPVGSNAGNNVAEYAALLLGLDGVLARYEPRRLEVRIDSTTVIRDVWGGRGSDVDGSDRYRPAIADRLGRVPAHDWVHLADSDPNPADALATVGADVAALGPGG
jgi:ribonuclease HI